MQAAGSTTLLLCTGLRLCQEHVGPIARVARVDSTKGGMSNPGLDSHQGGTYGKPARLNKSKGVKCVPTQGSVTGWLLR